MNALSAYARFCALNDEVVVGVVFVSMVGVSLGVVVVFIVGIDLDVCNLDISFCMWTPFTADDEMKVAH